MTRIRVAIWRSKNRDRALQMAREWRDRNPERQRKNHQLWLARNREHWLQQQREYRQRNPDARREYARSWRRRLPDKYLISLIFHPRQRNYKPVPRRRFSCAPALLTLKRAQVQLKRAIRNAHG